MQITPASRIRDHHFKKYIRYCWHCKKEVSGLHCPDCKRKTDIYRLRKDGKNDSKM
jgi:hypothetical protein